MHRRAGELRIEKRHRTVRVIQGMNGSLFANSPVLSYVVIAVIAFILGITVTAICYQLKKYQNEKDAGDLQC